MTANNMLCSTESDQMMMMMMIEYNAMGAIQLIPDCNPTFEC
jgi:hypothetical protein